MSEPGIVIIGAGLAGVSCAAELRARGYEGAVTLLNGEQATPYDRPPLSKQYAKGEQSLEEIRLRDEAWFAEQNISLENGCVVNEIQRDNRQVLTQDGRTFSYDKLLLATGSSARVFPGLESLEANVHYIRTLADADKFRNTLQAGRRLLFIGGGVIGMESAATAIESDCSVTVLEVLPGIMGRFFPREVADFLADYHRSKGVAIHLSIEISSISRDEQGQIVVQLSSGEAHVADELIIGIGAVPNTLLAEQAGLDIGRGISVDEHCRTSDANIYACGDAVEFVHPRYGTVRWENWKHAKDQGTHAAAAMLGDQQAYSADPWVWSDQYDLNIQASGRHDGDTKVLRGSMDEARFTMFHLRDGVVIGATSVNDGKSKRPAQKMIEEGRKVAPEILADTSVNLRKL